jgi:hypothetical protein
MEVEIAAWLLPPAKCHTIPEGSSFGDVLCNREGNEDLLDIYLLPE